MFPKRRPTKAPSERRGAGGAHNPAPRGKGAPEGCQPSPSRFAVRAVPLDSRRLLTVGPDSPAWRAERVSFGVAFAEAIVRIQPPAEATDEQVHAVVAALREAGAHVRVDPRPRLAAVPEVVQAAPASPKETLRQAVAVLAAEARTEDRAALGALCEGIMDEEGI